MNCKINKPYPEIKVENKNIMYASLLLKDYSLIDKIYLDKESLVKELW